MKVNTAYDLKQGLHKSKKWKRVRISFYALSIIFILCLSYFPLPAQTFSQSEQPLVYSIVIDDTVEKGLYAFLTRGFREAEEAGADHIFIDMDTYGGAVDAADKIGTLFQTSQIPTTVFVNPNAISAGAFIALSADHIIMLPQGQMGAAQVVDLEGNAGDAKAMSMWLKKMHSAAAENGRDPIYAEAMVEPAVVIEGVTKEGDLLTLTGTEALEYGYAEAVVSSREEALAFLGLENAIIHEVEISPAETIARFITNPIVASILLSLASLGLILELYSPGFGVPGIIGLSSLILFFFGHMIAGFAGWEALILLVVGIGLIVLELFTPSFGIFGILGIAGVITSLTMASVDVVAGLRSIGIAIVITVIVLLLLGKSMSKRGLWSKFVLQEDLSAEEGTSRFMEKVNLVGKLGVTATQLRPAGTVLIEGKRYDVVSEGNFVDKAQHVEVVHAEGTRIVVRLLRKES